MSLSVCIPVYAQRGAGVHHFKTLLSSLAAQGMRGDEEWEVCISDNEKTDHFRTLANDMPYRFGMPAYWSVKYQHNPIQGAAENLNAAIEMASHDKIKLMCMDDMLLDKLTLSTFDFMLERNGWVVAASRTMNDRGTFKRLVRAHYNPNDFEKNHTGMPSVVGFNKCKARFDPSLKTFTDLDFYRQLYDIYGMPGFIESPLIGQRYHAASQSRNQDATHKQDTLILKQRYDKAGSPQ